MIVNNNNIANRSYAPYQSNLSNLTRSAARLSTGQKHASVTDGSGELGVAHRMRNNIRGTNALLSAMQDAQGLAQTQDDILANVGDIITRMVELSTSAVDPTKSAADRDALDIEFQTLADEVADVAADAMYNGNRLFETTRTVRVGMEATDIIVLSAIQLSLLTFGALGISTVALASAALVSLESRVTSLAVLRARSRGHASRMERTLDYTRNYIANLSSAESALSDIDVAQETGEYTKTQVAMNVSQAVLAQTNNLPQGALQFLNF